MTDRRDGKQLANLSVAISTLDRPEALAQCLKAILSGRVLPAEIIVVDQSRDGRSKSIVEQLPPGPVRLDYVPHDGRGLGAAQNIAISRANTPIVAVTDDDCLPAEDWVAEIEQAFSGQIDALTGRVLPLGPQAPGLYPVSLRTSTTRVDFDRRAMPWDVGSGNNFAVKRDWLRRIGGNNERLGPGTPGLGGVDMDLFYRLLRAGACIRYEPDLLVLHAQTTREGRLARRIPYGHGMGTCCLLWLRQGDFNALRVLARWLLMRLRRLAGGLWRGRWLQAYEEILVLTGTLRGAVHAFTLTREPRYARTKDL